MTTIVLIAVVADGIWGCVNTTLQLVKNDACPDTGGVVFRFWLGIFAALCLF